MIRIYLNKDLEYNVPYQHVIAKIKNKPRGDKILIKWNRQVPILKKHVIVRYQQQKQETLFKIIKQYKNLIVVEVENEYK